MCACPVSTRDNERCPGRVFFQWFHRFKSTVPVSRVVVRNSIYKNINKGCTYKVLWLRICIYLYISLIIFKKNRDSWDRALKILFFLDYFVPASVPTTKLWPGQPGTEGMGVSLVFGLAVFWLMVFGALKG